MSRTVLGKVPILIRGQVYLVKIPILFGRVRFDVEKVISLIEGLARSMVDSLTTLEKKQLVDAFFAGYAFVYELEDLRTVCFGQLPNATVRILESALEDRDSAIDALIRPFPNTTNACFHAHQHAEKMLKGFFLSRGGVGEEHLKNRFGHSLEKLFRECLKQRTAFQQAKADIELLKQVSMEVRYTADKSSLDSHVSFLS